MWVGGSLKTSVAAFVELRAVVRHDVGKRSRRAVDVVALAAARIVRREELSRRINRRPNLGRWRSGRAAAVASLARGGVGGRLTGVAEAGRRRCRGGVGFRGACVSPGRGNGCGVCANRSARQIRHSRDHAPRDDRCTRPIIEDVPLLPVCIPCRASGRPVTSAGCTLPLIPTPHDRCWAIFEAPRCWLASCQERCKPEVPPDGQEDRLHGRLRHRAKQDRRISTAGGRPRHRGIAAPRPRSSDQRAHLPGVCAGRVGHVLAGHDAIST